MPAELPPIDHEYWDSSSARRARWPLLERSQDAYRQMIEQGILDCEWEERGTLHIYQDEKPFDKFAPTARLLQQEFELPLERLDGDQLRESSLSAIQTDRRACPCIVL